MPSMHPIWASALFWHAQEYALRERAAGTAIMIDKNRDKLNDLIATWDAPGPVVDEDVLMIVALSLLGPFTDQVPPQYIRDWLLDQRIMVLHQGAPLAMAEIKATLRAALHAGAFAKAAQRVRDVVVAFGTSGGEGYWEPPAPPPGVALDPAFTIWCVAPRWENARACLATEYLSKAVNDIDRRIHDLFGNSRTPYLKYAPEWLALKIMGIGKLFGPGTRLEFVGRATWTHVQSAVRLAQLGLTCRLSIQGSPPPAEWCESGGRRQLLNGDDLDLVWVASPTGHNVSGPLCVWPGEAVRVCGPGSFAVPALGGGYQHLDKTAAFEIRGVNGGLELWRVKPSVPLLPAVRRVFRIRDGGCIISAPHNHWQCQLMAGQSFFVLAQDIGCELYIDGHRAQSPGNNEPLVIETMGTLFEDPCSCGWSRCATAHRLSGWDPYSEPDEYISLSSFTASAVKGATRA